MIPDLVDIGAAWKVLPSGIHDATLLDVKDRFATNIKRAELFEGLARGCQNLESAKCAVVYLDGSYVTEKINPGDFDVCWDPVGVDIVKLDPVFLDLDHPRRRQKFKYGGEFFPSSAPADASQPFLLYFQKDRETGKEKGIVRIRL